MGRIQSDVGLISGLPIGELVDKTVEIAAKPRDLLVERTKTLQSEQAAYTELSALLLKLQFVVKNLGKTDLYRQRTAKSSAADYLTASVVGQPPNGTWQFTPLRIAQSQQFLSSGFRSDTQPLGYGTVSFRFGSHVERTVAPDLLGGGQGVTRGRIRIIDRSGAAAEINLSTAQSIDDVLDAINGNASINVRAVASGDHIRLIDNTQQTLSNLKVQEVGGGTTAASLGLAGIDVAANVADGQDMLRLYDDLALDALNDGNGVTANRVLPDIEYHLRDGTSGTIDLSPIIPGGSQVDEEQTLGDVFELINAAAPGKLKIEIAPDGDRLVVSDLTEGQGEFQLRAVNDSTALGDIGLDGSPAGGTLVGRRILSGMKTVLLESLNGGRGLGELGAIAITDRSGASASVDLSAAETLQDVVEAINAAGIGVVARANRARNGIEVVDTTGAAVSNLVIADAVPQIAGDANGDGSVDTNDMQAILAAAKFNSGQPATRAEGDFDGDHDVDVNDIQAILNAGRFNAGPIAVVPTAAKLQIAVDAATDSVNSGDLHLRVIAANTRLDALNGGAGVARGTFDIVDSAGRRTTVNLNQQSIQNIGDVIREINNLTADVQAELNASGDGILLRDLSRGSGTFRVVEGNTTTAADLHLLGAAAEVDFGGLPAQEIDGTTTYQIQLDADDSLEDLREAINDLHAGLTAATFVDGSSAPYRLTLVSDRAGKAGELVVDTSAAGFTLAETVRAQDALLSWGPSQSDTSVLLRSSSNTFRNVLTGVSLEIRQASANPVTVTVATTDTNLVATAKTMVENYNTFRRRLADLTRYDPETTEASVLTGDAVALRLDVDLSYLLSGRFAPISSIRALADVGISIDDDGTLSLDETKLRDAYADDPAAFEQFFAAESSGVAARLDQMIEQMCGVGNSLLAKRAEALDDKIEQNRARIEAMNRRLAAQRELLLTQFYRAEVAIGKMQATLSAISSIQALSPLVSVSK